MMMMSSSSQYDINHGARWKAAQPSRRSERGLHSSASPRAEKHAKRGTSYSSRGDRNRKSATVMTCARTVRRSLRSRIFEFGPGTPSSWSPDIRFLPVGTP